MSSEPKLRRLWFVFWNEPDLGRTTLLGASTPITIVIGANAEGPKATPAPEGLLHRIV